MIETDGRGDKMAIGLGCGVGGTKPPIRRAALLAKQSPGDGSVDLRNKATGRLRRSWRNKASARLGWALAVPSHHFTSPIGAPPGRGVVGARVLAKQSQLEGSLGFGETNPMRRPKYGC